MKSEDDKGSESEHSNTKKDILIVIGFILVTLTLSSIIGVGFVEGIFEFSSGFEDDLLAFRDYSLGLEPHAYSEEGRVGDVSAFVDLDWNEEKRVASAQVLDPESANKIRLKCREIFFFQSKSKTIEAESGNNISMNCPRSDYIIVEAINEKHTEAEEVHRTFQPY